MDIESSYQAPSENETQGMVGVAGMRTFTLTAQKPGSCYFRIAQERAYQEKISIDIEENGYNLIEVPVTVLRPKHNRI